MNNNESVSVYTVYRTDLIDVFWNPIEGNWSVMFNKMDPIISGARVDIIIKGLTPTSPSSGMKLEADYGYYLEVSKKGWIVKVELKENT